MSNPSQPVRHPFGRSHAMTRRPARISRWIVVAVFGTLLAACDRDDHMNHGNQMDHTDHPMKPGESK